jgi:hypothetical protein
MKVKQIDKDWIVILVATLAFVVSVLSYLNSRSALQITRSEVEVQNRIFWNVKVDETEPCCTLLDFVSLADGQIPQHLLVKIPNQISEGYLQVSKNEYKFSISGYEEQVLDYVESKMSWAEDTTLVAEKFFTFIMPVGVMTNYSSGGDLHEDVSIYYLIFDLRYDFVDGNLTRFFDYGNFSFRERTDLPLTYPYLVGELLDNVWEKDLEARSYLYAPAIELKPDTPTRD